MNTLIEQIGEIGIIPVIKLKNIEDAMPLANALIAGNMPTAEVTFRAAGAEKVIKEMRKRFPEMLVGAGTVVNIEQAKKAVEAGSKFIVSPGFDEEIVSYCLKQNVIPFPGCVTPSELQRALKLGLKAVKFFPSEQYGGLATIKAFSGPFGELKFMPTGGISLKNLAEYAANKNIIACGASFMVAEKYIEAKDWTKITKLCGEAIEIVKNARKL